MTPAHPARLSRWMWLAAAVLMLAEFLLFDRMTSAHHASIYPRWNDQIQYLRESYTAFEEAKLHGLAAGLKMAVSKPALQGTMHDTTALVLFWLLGSASRSAALSLNMLVFIAWQIALLAAIPRMSGSRALGWMGFGLILCLAGPWSAEPGSAVDFRLDHAAMCLFGIAAVIALLTRGFRSWRWSLVFGLAVAVTLLERFLTGVYFAAIFMAAAIWIACGRERAMRIRNLLLAGITATILAGPMFWLNRTTIYNYYWVGHISGAESAARLRAMDHWQAIRFVFQYLGDMHLGAWFGWTAAGITLALIILRVALPRKPATDLQRDWLFVALAFLLLPALALAVHPQKSELVLGILVPGTVLLLLWLWAILRAAIDFTGVTAWQRYAPAVLALMTVVAGERYFVQRQFWQPHSALFLESDRTAKVIADRIFNDAHKLGITNPVIGVDQIVDFMDAQILQIICYERHKVWIWFGLQLPQSILGEKDDVIRYRLKLCDFVLLTDEMDGDGYWPYDRQMRRLYPELKAWCEAHLRRTQTYTLFGRQMSLYERPDKS